VDHISKNYERKIIVHLFVTLRLFKKNVCHIYQRLISYEDEQNIWEITENVFEIVLWCFITILSHLRKEKIFCLVRFTHIPEATEIFTHSSNTRVWWVNNNFMFFLRKSFFRVGEICRELTVVYTQLQCIFRIQLYERFNDTKNSDVYLKRFRRNSEGECEMCFCYCEFRAFVFAEKIVRLNTFCWVDTISF
jgi:hypothetical protein